MSKKQKDENLDFEDDDVKFKMQISNDRKYASLEIFSGQEMSEQDIVEFIEYWLYDNILEGYQPGRDIYH